MLCANISFAQKSSYQITLKVTDAATALPITGVTITIPHSDIKGNSDAAGLYRLVLSHQEAKIPVIVKYSAVGYKALQQKILITKDTTIVISLDPAANRLREVQIKGRQAAITRTSISSTLSNQQLEKTRGGTLGEVLTDISGVNLLKSGSTISKPIIHGLYSNRILILNNGIRLEGQQWGAEHAPEIDPFIAQQIHVIKGAESVKYGAEAIGGIVITEPPALPQTATVSGNVNLIGASNGRAVTTAAMLTGGLKGIEGFGWRVQGSAKKSGNIKTADYYLGNTGVRELNFSAAAGYKTGHSNYEAYYSRFSTELGILYSAHIGTIEDINARIAAGRPLENYGFSYDITAPRQKVSHQLLKLTGHYDLNHNNVLNITYAFQKNHRKEYDTRRGDREAIPITDLVLNTHTVDVKLDMPISDGVKRSYGINSMVQVNNNISGTLANTFIPNFDSYTAGAFVVQHWIKEKYEFEAGLRYDYKYFDAAGFRYSYTTAQDQQSENTEQYYGGSNSFNNVTGSAGIIWKFNLKWHLASNIGLAWRSPTANELYSNGLHHGAGLYEVGNPAMRNEKGYKWITSLKHSGTLVKFNLDVYLQYINNYIYSRPDLHFKQTISGTYPVFRYTQTNATFAGIDFTGTYQFLPAFSYQLNASLVRAKDVTAKNYLPYIPADRMSQAIHWDLDLKGTYLQFKHSFVCRQNRFEAESDYAPPPGSYHLFTMTAGTSVKFGQQVMSINMSADNLFNVLYKDYMNRYRYYTHDIGRNLTLRLAYKF